MSRTWYFIQNPDVKQAEIPAFLHFIKYGRKELRNWQEPKWFRGALGPHGWIRRNSRYFFLQEKISEESLTQNYREISIYRPGVYNREIKIMKSASVDYSSQQEF
jgi:hypothetical protein